MEPEASKKRLHSALTEPSIAQGTKRTKHDPESAQSAIITRTEASSFEKHSFESQPQNKPRCLNQRVNPTEQPSGITHSEPCNAQISGTDIENDLEYVLAPGVRFEPLPIAAPDFKLPKNKRRSRLPRDPISQSSNRSSGECSRFILNSEPSFPNTSMFLPRFQ